MRDYRDVSRIVGAKESWSGPTAGSVTTHRSEGAVQRAGTEYDERAKDRRDKNPYQHTSPSRAVQV